MSQSNENEDFSLFDQEEWMLKRTESMLRSLEDVAEGVRALADAYRQSYKEQRRLIQLSDRVQLDLHTANERLKGQAAALQELNETLQREIHYREQVEAELRHIARTDTLTGAASRGHLFEMMRHEMRRARRHSSPLSLLVMDLDRFKRVNDMYGHSAGDAALQAFAQACRDCLRESDLFGRTGGEEFVVMLPDSALGDAAGVAERIRSRIEGNGIPWEEGLIWLTVSIGVASVDVEGGSLEQGLKHADDALYQAKGAGRNRVVLAQEPA